MQQVFLKMVPDGVNPVIYATQNDDGRVFRFKLLNSDESDAYVLNGTETITAKIVKPDNTEITIAITNPGIGKDYCDMVIGSDDCDLAGVYIGEASLLDYGRTLGSINFILKVEPDAYDGANVVVMDCGPADICTFETNLADNLVSLIANITASGGGGTPSTPIPIVGHSELNLVRCGKNFFNASEENITDGANICTISGNVITNTGANAYDAVRFEQPLKEGNYVIHASNISANGIIRLDYYDGSYVLLGYMSANSPTLTFTMPVNTTLRISLYSSEAGGMSVTDLQCELGSTPSAYEPYNGQTFTVQFGQTVYGGVYDANRGKIKITHARVNMGDLTYWDNGTIEGGHQFATNITDKALGTLNILSSMFEALYPSNVIGKMAGRSNSTTVSFNSAEATVAAFKTSVAGQDLVYELATPIEIDVSELSVDAIVGVNNVFGDTGEVELKYLKIEG